MSHILEILGRGVVYNPADLLVHWLDQGREQDWGKDGLDPQVGQMIDLLLDKRLESAEEMLRSYCFAETVPVPGLLVAAALSLYQNDIPQAIEDLETVYRQQPCQTLVLYSLGYCYERINDEEKAIAFYQDCLKCKNHLQLPAQRLAALYLKQQRYEAAVSLYELLHQEYPADSQVLLSLGHLYLAMGQVQRAIDNFSRAIIVHPDSLQMEDHELDRLLQEHNFDEALAYVDGLLDIYPNRVDLLTKRGDVLQFMGDVEQSLLEYRQALTLTPDNIDACVKLGALYFRTQHLEQAARCFGHALEVHDRIIDAYLGLALAHYQDGQKDQALAAMCSASMIQPNSSMLFYETARALLLSMSATDIGEMLEPEADPQETVLAVLHAHQGRVMAEPNHPLFHYQLGLCQLYAAGPATAIYAFSSATESHPCFPRANAKLALCMYAVGDCDNALKQLTSLPAITTESLQLHYQTALLYSEPVKFAATMMNLSRTMADSWTDIDHAAQITVVLESLGIINREDYLQQNLREILADITISHGGEDDGPNWS